jgi:hypothetical protein
MGFDPTHNPYVNEDRARKDIMKRLRHQQDKAKMYDHFIQVLR